MTELETESKKQKLDADIAEKDQDIEVAFLYLFIHFQQRTTSLTNTIGEISFKISQKMFDFEKIFACGSLSHYIDEIL